MTDRRMDAYYYGFDSVGHDAIDKVLSAVACAGKAYHHTEDWADPSTPRDDHTGDTPVAWIQNAAKEAATRLAALEADLARARERVEALERERDAAWEKAADKVSSMCPKCDGEGWLWGYELAEPPDVEGHDDTRYSCDSEVHEYAAAIRALKPAP